MALRKTKSTTLTGESIIDGVTVVRMTASLSTNGGNDYVNQSVLSVDKYHANKRDVRKDISSFQDYVYEQQDAIDAELAEESKDTTVTDK